MAENNLLDVLEGRVPTTTEKLNVLLGKGEGYWKDAQHTSGSPQTILAGTTGVFTVDGLGATTDLSQLNSLPETTWSSNKINPEVSGESYDVRFDLTVVRSSNNNGQWVSLELDIGSGSEIIILSRRVDLVRGATEPHVTSIGVPIFCRNTFFNNGGRILLKPTEDVEVYGKAIFLRREYRP